MCGKQGLVLTKDVYDKIRELLGDLGMELNDDGIIQIRGGVSGATLCKVELKPNGRGLDYVMVKNDSGVGDRERRGSSILETYNLKVPEYRIFGCTEPDVHIAEYIGGVTIHDLVTSEVNCWRIIKKMLAENVTMWTSSITQKSDSAIGYCQKIDHTESVLRDFMIRVNNHKCSLGELWNVPIMLNGRSLPPLSELFESVRQTMQNYNFYCMQHGDEGAGNYIKSGRSHKGRVFTIDAEKVGIRLLVEGYVKFLCWFPEVKATPTNVERSIEVALEGGKLNIDFETRLPPHLRRYVQRVREYLDLRLAHKGIIIEPQIRHAFSAFYFWRAIQWQDRRITSGGSTRDYFKAYLFAMGLTEARKMLGIK